MQRGAPAELREDVGRYFEFEADSPYMLMVAPVRPERRRAMTAEEQALFGIDKLNVPRSDIPAVTHVDYSARIQTVHRETNAAYHDLIARFRDKTGCAVIVNTSFNVRGEPIVAPPRTLSAASWAARSRRWWSATACCSRKSRIRR